MGESIESRLAGLGVTLPHAPAPAAVYVPYRKWGNLVHISGQVPWQDGKVVTGKLGAGTSVEEGAAAARLCAIFVLAQLRDACGGDLNRVETAIKLTGFVNATLDFTEHPQVVNGASEFIEAALGEAGKHARSAIGVASLPLGAAVEVEGVFSIRGSESAD